MLLPRVDLTDVATYLYAADCLVIPPTDEPLRRYGRTVLPMKIFSYMAAGRPILAPALPDIREVLTDDVNAVLVAPGDVHGAARSVRALLENRPRADALGLSARASARDYTWEARATRITSWLANEILR
ncbi:MAG: glycosyltransferase [Vicinamibacterales bacterium]